MTDTADTLRAMVRNLNGSPVPGGCDECDAYQTMEENPDFPQMFLVRIHHDDWCPSLTRTNKKQPNTNP